VLALRPSRHYLKRDITSKKWPERRRKPRPERQVLQQYVFLARFPEPKLIVTHETGAARAALIR